MSSVRSESSQRAGPDSGSEPETARIARFCGAVLVVLSLLGAGWLLARLAGFQYGLDQGIYAVVARVMRAGGAPYRDAWDFKTPGIFFVYALAQLLFGGGMEAVRWLEVAGLVSLVVAFALYARRFTGSVWPGLAGGALAVSGHVWLGFWQTAQPESFGAVLLAWALYLATASPASARSQRLLWAGAGAAYAAAALLKPPLGGGLLVSYGFAARRTLSGAEPGSRASALLGPGVAFGAGAALPLVLVLAYLAAKGALGALHEALFEFAPGYTALNYHSGSLPGFALHTLELLLLRFSPLLPIGVLLLLVLPPLAAREREGALHVAGVLLFCLAGVALQGRFFPYHYGAAVPLLSLLAGFGLWKLVLVPWGRSIALGPALLALLVFFTAHALGAHGVVPGGFLQRVRTVDAGYAYDAPLRRVAAFVRAHTRPDDAIYVFGFQPMLYDLAHRRPASRFIYNAPQRAPWFASRGRDALMRDLARDPPAAILVESGDVHPGTAGTSLDSATTLERFPRLARLLARDYDAGREIGSFRIHLRRHGPGRSPPGPAPP